MEEKIVVPETTEKPETELKTETPLVDNAAPVVEEEMVSIPKSQLDTILATTEEITKIAEKKTLDAQNYQKGMIKALGKLKDNGLEEEEPKEVISPENLAEIVKKAVDEKMASITPPLVEEDELTKLKKQNEELKRAFTNTSQISQANTSMGSNLDKPQVETKYFSSEVEAELRQRAARIGVDPDKFIKDVQANDMTGNAGAWRPVDSSRFKNV